jgi:hypothetical protein
VVSSRVTWEPDMSVPFLGERCYTLHCTRSGDLSRNTRHTAHSTRDGLFSYAEITEWIGSVGVRDRDTLPAWYGYVGSGSGSV